jgi:hypothetical protein
MNYNPVLVYAGNYKPNEMNYNPLSVITGEDKPKENDNNKVVLVSFISSETLFTTSLSKFIRS